MRRRDEAEEGEALSSEAHSGGGVRRRVRIEGYEQGRRLRRPFAEKVASDGP